MTLQETIALAIEHQRAGRYAQAVDIWREVVVSEPNSGPILRLFGEAMIESGHLVEGADLLRQAIALNPQLPVYNTLGHTLLRLGRIKDAIDTFEGAIRRDPRDFIAVSNLGTGLFLDGRGDEAAKALRTATEINPNDKASWSALVLALSSCGKIDEAIAAAREALQIDPQSLPSLQALSSLLQSAGEFEAAESAARQAFVLAPDEFISNMNLGSALLSRGAHDLAVKFIEKAIELGPNLAEPHVLLGNLRCGLGEVDAAMKHYHRAIEVAPEKALVHSALLMPLHYQPIESDALLKAHRDWEHCYTSPYKARMRPSRSERAPERRLRVGYVSSDFREHPISYFFQPLIQAHDHERYEIICYSTAVRHDSVTTEIRRYADRWHEIVGLGDEQFIDLVRDHEIDILIDLALHTAGGRLVAMAARPAPVQMSYLGYCSTTGMSYIDWRITDAVLDPPGITESWHTESLLRLPGGFCCYRPPEQGGAIAPGREHAITFGSFNKLAKITEQQVALWCQILQRVPDSRLLIQASGADQTSFKRRLKEMLVAGGVSQDRVMFHGSQPVGDYLQAISGVDIALDSFPFNGHTTTCHSLWMGVPVVTLYGSTPISRVGLSLLTQLQMTDLTAAEPARYVEIAVELARDCDRRHALRYDLRKRMLDSPLMDNQRQARELESAFRAVWVEWCAS